MDINSKHWFPSIWPVLQQLNCALNRSYYLWYESQGGPMLAKIFAQQNTWFQGYIYHVEAAEISFHPLYVILKIYKHTFWVQELPSHSRNRRKGRHLRVSKLSSSWPFLHLLMRDRCYWCFSEKKNLRKTWNQKIWSKIGGFLPLVMRMGRTFFHQIWEEILMIVLILNFYVLQWYIGNNGTMEFASNLSWIARNKPIYAALTIIQQ